MFLLGQLKALQLFILKSSKQNETNQKKTWWFLWHGCPRILWQIVREMIAEKKTGVWKIIQVENKKVSEYRDRQRSTQILWHSMTNSNHTLNLVLK